MRKKYIIITKDLQKNLIEFLDEIQFDAAADKDSESMQKVNFCNWAINELLGGWDAQFKDKDKPKKSKKSRSDYVDETFLDWNLPEMSDDEYEKLVDQFDAFLRGWEKDYFKDNPKKKPDKERPRFNKPDLEDVSEYMSLEEIKEYLLDESELTPEERFELYYEEHRRVKNQYDEKKVNRELNKMLKNLGISPASKKK